MADSWRMVIDLRWRAPVALHDCFYFQLNFIMAYFSLKSSSLFFIQNHGDLVLLHSYKGRSPIVFNVGNEYHYLHRSDSTQSTDQIAMSFIFNFKIYVAKIETLNNTTKQDLVSSVKL